MCLSFPWGSTIELMDLLNTILGVRVIYTNYFQDDQSRPSTINITIVREMGLSYLPSFESTEVIDRKPLKRTFYVHYELSKKRYNTLRNTSFFNIRINGKSNNISRK